MNIEKNQFNNKRKITSQILCIYPQFLMFFVINIFIHNSCEETEILKKNI